MTRRERMEARLEKREEWAGKASAASASAFQGARDAVSGIPLGQPILVGHHSEKRHRGDLARHDSRMRKGIERSDMAAHHASKAAGIERQLDSTIYSDDDNAVEALEAKMARLEAERKQRRDINSAYRKTKSKVAKTRDAGVAALAAFNIDDAWLAKHFAKLPSYDQKQPFPGYSLSNLGGRISSIRKRIEHVKQMQENTAAAEAAGGMRIHRGDAAGDSATVFFAEKPTREIINSLKAAGFWWNGGAWWGKESKIPEEVRRMEI